MQCPKRLNPEHENPQVSFSQHLKDSLELWVFIEKPPKLARAPGLWGPTPSGHSTSNCAVFYHLNTSSKFTLNAVAPEPAKCLTVGLSGCYLAEKLPCPLRTEAGKKWTSHLKSGDSRVPQVSPLKTQLFLTLTPLPSPWLQNFDERDFSRQHVKNFDGRRRTYPFPPELNF